MTGPATRRAGARRLAIGGVTAALVLTLVLGAVTVIRNLGPAGAAGDDPASNSVRVAGAVAELPQRHLSDPPTQRMATGLAPPTNRWFSGLVFPAQPEPVFPLPLSVGLRLDGLSIGLPEVRADAKTIFGAHTPGPDLALGAAGLRVVAYDDLTVTVAYLDATGGERGRVLVAQGSPFVRYTATVDQHVGISPPGLDPAGGAFRIRQTTFGVASNGRLAANGADLAAGQWVSLYAVPPGADAAALRSAATVEILGGSATDRIDGENVQTTLDYRTVGGTPLVGAMPGSGATCPGRPVGTFATLYGPMPLCSTNTLTLQTPVVHPSGALDLGGLSAAERDELSAAVRADTATVDLSAPDTYFGGKQLARAANLLTLAKDLRLTDQAAQLRERLSAELRRWAEPDGCTRRQTHCFVYDPTLRGVIGLQSSFGSEQFNDHHFHYGYFLFAAAVVAADDPALAESLAPVIDLLAADIGSPTVNDYFPRRRLFDAYAGHSWASGFSPFGDGNNLESSSESVAAYNGLALWSAVRGRNTDQAVAMLSREAYAARRYWLQPDPVPGFDRRIVSINWGGKRDYATWFSAEPSAILGIQLIPMAPIAPYLAGDPDRIRANLTEAAPRGYNVPFGDYLLMYLALADRDAALAGARALPASFIDDGNSRSYLLAWIMSRPRR